jgi:hypothetical protein
MQRRLPALRLRPLVSPTECALGSAMPSRMADICPHSAPQRRERGQPNRSVAAVHGPDAATCAVGAAIPKVSISTDRSFPIWQTEPMDVIARFLSRPSSPPTHRAPPRHPLPRRDAAHILLELFQHPLCPVLTLRLTALHLLALLLRPATRAQPASALRRMTSFSDCSPPYCNPRA